MTAFTSLATPLHWAAFALLAAGVAALWLPRAKAGAKLGFAALLAGLAALTVSIAVRWIASGRPPVLGTFENSLVAAWMVTAVALLVASVGPFRRLPHLTRLVAPWALAVLAYGLAFEREPMRLEAAGRSVVGYLHALAGWAAFAVLLAATMSAAGLLLSKGEDGSLRWDQALSRLAGVGFALLTATMASGSIYSMMLFSDWYRWQIVEVLSAAAWLAYGLLLHSRLLQGWRGARLAWSTLAVTPLMLAAFWIWSVYPDTYHYFERVLTLR